MMPAASCRRPAGKSAPDNAAYLKIARDTSELGSFTLANGRIWDPTEPFRGQFSYGKGDAVANVVKQTGQILRCHTLAWHSQLPPWGMLESTKASSLGKR